MNVSVLIVFFSFLVLGIILTMTISSYWLGERKIILDKRAENIAEYVGSNVRVGSVFRENDDEFRWLSDEHAEYMAMFLNMFADDSDADIFITDKHGRVVMFAPFTSADYFPEYLPQNIMTSVASDGSYFVKDDMNGIYETERYISARPINNLSSASVVGYVVITTDTSDIEEFTDMVLRIFLLSAIATLAMSILAIGLFSYNMMKPLRQMSQAAKQFGKGDFNIRVSYSGDDEIGELAVAFNNMAESLSASEVTRKSFIANVSHELKTPMTTIAGFIDGILDGTIPAEKQNYYLHIVSDEVKRLSRLVRSMLDLSRIDSGELKLNYQSFDLLDTLVTIIITFEKEIENKKIDIRGLDTITPKTVYGDKDLLHQVVYNLIENAVKFTNVGGYIEFNIIESLEQFDFVIKNSGMGIKDSEIDLVFGRFYKTDKSRSKDKKGLGLGLYLVRSIIRLHGGDISAKSFYGEYTEFDFYIPKKSVAKKPEKKPDRKQEKKQDRSADDNTKQNENQE